MVDPIELYWSRCEGPIQHGANDCCLTVADVVRSAGGPDLMQAYRGRYRTRLGFVRAFRKAGHASLIEAVDAALQAHGIKVAVPGNFDVAIVSYLDAGEAMASPAFFHSGFWMLRTEHGALCTEAHGLSIYRVI